MTAIEFEQHRPDSIDGALALLAEYGEDAIIYAGGTEVILLAKVGLVDARRLIGVTRIGDLRAITATGEGGVRVGAAATHAAVRRSADVGRVWPVLADTVRSVGNLRVQSMGTIGGNVCFADPQSDLATCLVTLGARVGCVGTGGRVRALPVEDFVVDAYTTTLLTGEELLGWVELPARPPRTVMCYDKVVFEERPVAAAGARLQLDNDGAVAMATVFVGALTPAPVRAAAAVALTGSRPADVKPTQLREVARACVAEILDSALAASRTAFMESVTADLVERVLGSAIEQCALVA